MWRFKKRTIKQEAELIIIKDLDKVFTSCSFFADKYGLAKENYLKLYQAIPNLINKYTIFKEWLIY